MKRSATHIVQTVKSVLLVMALAFVSEMTVGQTPSAGPTPSSERARRVVLIAGRKAHEPGGHENLKTVKLLKALLDRAPNLKNVETEIYFNGWPDDPRVLDGADTIVTFSEGEDGFGAPPVPFMTDERMKVMERQMTRGCGFMTFHFSTFASLKYADKILEWGGGFFDWQGGHGEGGYFGRHGQGGTERWHSALSDFSEDAPSTRYEISAPGHPVTDGVKPFEMPGEYYYQIRFRPNDPRLTPILRVPTASAVPEDQIVSWAVQRADGGRGFAVTPGHLFANFQNDDFRRLILNAIVWTAGANVPKGGVQSNYLKENEVNPLLMTSPIPTLLINAGHASRENWKTAAPVLAAALNSETPRFDVTVADNLHALAGNLSNYRLIVLSGCEALANGLSTTEKNQLGRYLNNGGGLSIVYPSGTHSDAVSRRGGESRKKSPVDSLCKHVYWKQLDKESAGIVKSVSVADKAHPSAAYIEEGHVYIPYTFTFAPERDVNVHVIAEARGESKTQDEPVAFVAAHPHARIYHVIVGDIAQRQIENDVVGTLDPILVQFFRYGSLWAAGQR